MIYLKIILNYGKIWKMLQNENCSLDDVDCKLLTNSVFKMIFDCFQKLIKFDID